MSPVRDESEDGHYVSRSIGAILVDAGRLSAADAETVLKHQRQMKAQFGRAAVALGLVSEADIAFALARQFEYPYLLPGQTRVSEAVVAAYDPFGAQVESLRAIRTQLLLRLFDGIVNRKRLAVVSPNRGDGRSYVAANLAVVFSQLGEKTLLIDADMRHPAQHQFFGIENDIGLSSMLSGRAGPECICRIPILIDLSILPSGARPPNPTELLGRSAFPQLLSQLAEDYDVIIIDTPASSKYAEAITVAGKAGAAVIVARKDVSRVNSLQQVAHLMSQAHVDVVGAIMNEP